MKSAPSTSPRRRLGSEEIGTGRAASERRRSILPSDIYIPRTHSGLYGEGAAPAGSFDDNENDDNKSAYAVLSPPPVRTTTNRSYLLPFELSRNRNTEWISEGGPALLATYISILLTFLLTFLAFVEPKVAWTLISFSHAMVSLCYLHWIKGNPAGYMDGTQGEMCNMTLWEQIVSKPNQTGQPSIHLSDVSKYSPARNLQGSLTRAIKKLRSRDVLCVIPTLLAHASCHIARYQYQYVLVNMGAWAVVMLPKMPFMNGVRLFGINRTAGIDDCVDLDDVANSECFETEEELSEENEVGLEFDSNGQQVVEFKKDR